MSKSQAKKDREYMEMVACCVRNSNSRRKDPKEQKKWFEKYASNFNTTPYETKPVKVSPLSCAVTSIDRSKWKKNIDPKEEEAQKEIDRKRTRIAPSYNKGAYQYITNVNLVKGLYIK
jgi:hypothetical protein